jgi:hypothetical protein
MAYTPVKTVQTGDSWTAKDVNAYVKDNFAASIPDLMTTKGDIIVATGIDAGIRVGIGANDLRLTAEAAQASGVKWGKGSADLITTKGDVLIGLSDQVISRLGVGANDAYLSARTAVTGGIEWVACAQAKAVSPNGSMTTDSSNDYIRYDIESWDTAGNQIINTDPWSYTTTKAGYYFISLWQGFAAQAWVLNEFIKVRLFVNDVGAEYLAMKWIQAAGTFVTAINGCTIHKCAANDVLKVAFISDNAATASINYGVTAYEGICIARIGGNY